MSKIRQAVNYERRAAKAQDKAHRALSIAEHETERQLREQAISYERKYTDGQFGQLNLVAQEHRVFHEREHILYEDAIEKASTSLGAMLAALQTDVDRLREESQKWMTIERFEREHSNLTEKVEASVGNLADKVGAEEKVTLGQTIQQETLQRVADNSAVSRRWLIGLVAAVALGIFGNVITITLFIIHLAFGP